MGRILMATDEPARGQPSGEKVLLQHNRSQHFQNRSDVNKETPGSRMSRAIPDEWKPAVTWFCSILLFAFFYKRLVFYVPDDDPSKAQNLDLSQSFKEWRHDLFDCCGEPLFFMMSCLFPSISLADSCTKTRLGAFFATAAVSGALISLNFMVLVLPWCAFAA